ncbi:MAG: flagellar hook-length control protein FliK [Pyrinomonadaceae bacterium]
MGKPIVGQTPISSFVFPIEADPSSSVRTEPWKSVENKSGESKPLEITVDRSILTTVLPIISDGKEGLHLADKIKEMPKPAELPPPLMSLEAPSTEELPQNVLPVRQLPFRVRDIMTPFEPTTLASGDTALTSELGPQAAPKISTLTLDRIKELLTPERITDKDPLPSTKVSTRDHPVNAVKPTAVQLFSVESKPLEINSPETPKEMPQNMLRTTKGPLTALGPDDVPAGPPTNLFASLTGLEPKSKVDPGNGAMPEISTREIWKQIEPPLAQLAMRIQIGGGKHTLKMRLNPAELGTVEVTLERNVAGKINAHFQTESENAQQILSEGLAQLRASLEKSGMQVGDLKISFDATSTNGDGRRQDQTQQFDSTEQGPVMANRADGNSATEDDKQARLVNLRA